MRERQELWCHECQRYVQFDIDVSLNGNHIIECPNCGHEHCRVVENGEVTDVRWGSRNQSLATYTASSASSSDTSTFTIYSTNTGAATDSGTTLRYNAWMNLTTHG